MNSDGLPIIGHNIDLNQIEPISPQRTLAYLNYFISETVSSLNKFSSLCDYRCHNLHIETQNLEASLAIIEAKLSSIEWLNNNQTKEDNNQTEKHLEFDKHANSNISEQINNSNIQKVTENKPADETQITNTIKNKENPTYKKYFTMLSLGIPINAIKQKMGIDNIDPGIIDKPDETSFVEIQLEDKSNKENDFDDDDDDHSSDFSD